jgi:hypothetical protein
MTSQQLSAKLDRAIGLLGRCEALLEDPHSASSSWDAVDLKNRIGDFMDLHRQDQRDGGQP